MCETTSTATRFDEIFPIGQHFTSRNFKCLFCIWQNFELTLASKFAIGPFLFLANGQNFEKVIQPSGHTVGEQVKQDR